MLNVESMQLHINLHYICEMSYIKAFDMDGLQGVFKFQKENEDQNKFQLVLQLHCRMCKLGKIGRLREQSYSECPKSGRRRNLDTWVSGFRR